MPACTLLEVGYEALILRPGKHRHRPRAQMDKAHVSLSLEKRADVGRCGFTAITASQAGRARCRPDLLSRGRGARIPSGPPFCYYQRNLITMPVNHEIRCINKDDRFNPHERIQYVGGVNPDGGAWKITQPRAIQYIEDGEISFYVKAMNGHSVWVIVASRNGVKYLKTENDGDTPDNLLYLPECP